jgi:hypothetical protein
LKTKPRRLIKSKENSWIPESLDSTETTEKNDEYNEVVLNQSDDDSKRKYSSRLDFVDEKSKQSLFDDDLSMIARESHRNENRDDDETKSFLKTTENIIDIKNIFPTDGFPANKENNLLANGNAVF